MLLFVCRSFHLQLALGTQFGYHETARYEADDTQHAKGDKNGVVVCLEQTGNGNGKHESQNTLNCLQRTRSRADIFLRELSGKGDKRGTARAQTDSATHDQPAEHHEYPGINAKWREPAEQIAAGATGKANKGNDVVFLNNSHKEGPEVTAHEKRQVNDRAHHRGASGLQALGKKCVDAISVDEQC